MKLLKKLSEDAAGGAVGAGAVAGFASPLFAGFVRRPGVTSSSPKKSRKKGKVRVGEAFNNILRENGLVDDPHFDQSEVLSKLKHLEQKDKINKDDSVSFGLEDDSGNTVRVTVQSDQADDFEQALQALLANERKKDEQPEIAEILFQLRSQFNILDVVWPEVEEDQEEQQQLDPSQQGQDGEGQPGEGEQDPENAEGADDMTADAGVGEEEVSSLLQQVIDMMKSDADARKADAVARQKEAEERAQQSTARIAKAKVKREEELLDMDTYNKNKKAAEKESQQLAKLAKWKHEVADDDSDIDFGVSSKKSVSVDVDNDENEEFDDADIAPVPKIEPRVEQKKADMKPTSNRVSSSEVADFILSRIR